MGDTPRQENGRRAALSPKRHSGVVTLLFTDVVGSTALKQRLGDKAGLELLVAHHELVRNAVSRCDGAREIKTAGDSFFITFPTPSAAVSFANAVGVESNGRIR